MKDPNKKRESILDTLIFLFPGRLVKTQHYSKKDVRNIRDNLTKSFSLVNLIVALILFVLMSGLLAFMMISSNGNFVAVYGATSLIGNIIIIAGSFITAILVLISRYLVNEKTGIKIARFAADVLYLAAASYIICCIHADAFAGYTVESETLSASIIFLAVLVLIQPMHWNDAIILDLLTSIAIVAISIFCNAMYKMGAIHYYILIAIFYPFAGYLVLSLLFYAEAQRYTQILENERLHNRAYYDNLTRCKNRHALSEFLTENKFRWENKENVNLLIVLFDIDDFKKYNDQFSHLGGDYCLRSICDAVREKFPSPSLDFFRYGGEEFLLFFELRNPEDAPIVLKEIKESVSTLEIEAPIGAPKNTVTISVGGLLIRNVNEFEFENELKIVDAYLYQAKASGKDVVCYNGNIMN